MPSGSQGSEESEVSTRAGSQYNSIQLKLMYNEYINVYYIYNVYTRYHKVTYVSYVFAFYVL